MSNEENIKATKSLSTFRDPLWFRIAWPILAGIFITLGIVALVLDTLLILTR